MNPSSKIKLMLCLAGLALLALPALSLGGKGKLVGKDSGSGRSAVAVATATVRNPGRLSLTIASKPRHKKVDWSYTTDCSKNGGPDRPLPATR